MPWQRLHMESNIDEFTSWCPYSLSGPWPKRTSFLWDEPQARSFIRRDSSQEYIEEGLTYETLSGDYGVEIPRRYTPTRYHRERVDQRSVWTEISYKVHQDTVALARVVHLVIFADIYGRHLEVGDIEKAGTVSHVMAHVLKLLDFYQISDFGTPAIERALLSQSDIWKDISNQCLFYWGLGQKLQSALIFVDALKHMVGKDLISLTGTVENQNEYQWLPPAATRILDQETQELVIYTRAQIVKYVNEVNRGLLQVHDDSYEQCRLRYTEDRPWPNSDHHEIGVLQSFGLQVLRYVLAPFFPFVELCHGDKGGAVGHKPTSSFLGSTWWRLRNSTWGKFMFRKMFNFVNDPAARDRLKITDLARTIVQRALQGKLWIGSVGYDPHHSLCLLNTPLPVQHAAQTYYTIQRAAFAGNIEFIQPGLLAEKAALFELNESHLRAKVNKQVAELQGCFCKSPLFEVCDHNRRPSYFTSIWLEGVKEAVPCHRECTHWDRYSEAYFDTAEAQSHRAWYETDDHFTWLDVGALQAEGLYHSFMDWEAPNDLEMLWPDPPVPTKPASEKTMRLMRNALELLPARLIESMARAS